MIKGENKNPDLTIVCKAYDSEGEVIDTADYQGRLEPHIVFFEFYTFCREQHKEGKFRRAVRFTCEVAE